MFPDFPHLPQVSLDTIAAASVLHQRGEVLQEVIYLERGQVCLGVLGEGQMRQQFGTIEGPFWLDAVAALLDGVCGMDMVAETTLAVRRYPLEAFVDQVQLLPQDMQLLLRDMARGYRQQSELAISRLAQDAESRCAQWLLSHANTDEAGHLAVTLRQRKRMIAAQLGIAPETFSRVLRGLRDQGLVVGSGSLMHLPQPSALQAIAVR